jgi:hypothetical protein
MDKIINNVKEFAYTPVPSYWAITWFIAFVIVLAFLIIEIEKECPEKPPRIVETFKAPPPPNYDDLPPMYSEDTNGPRINNGGDAGADIWDDRDYIPPGYDDDTRIDDQRRARQREAERRSRMESSGGRGLPGHHINEVLRTSTMPSSSNSPMAELSGMAADQLHRASSRLSHEKNSSERRKNTERYQETFF